MFALLCVGRVEEWGGIAGWERARGGGKLSNR